MLKVYVKKPVEIMAMKLERTVQSIGDLKIFMEAGIKKPGDILSEICNPRFTEMVETHILSGDGVTIPTLEGEMKANWGDYIIRGVKGEFYPCKPDIFEMTYDEKPNAKRESYKRAIANKEVTAKLGRSVTLIFDEFSKEDISANTATEHMMNSTVL